MFQDTLQGIDQHNNKKETSHSDTPAINCRADSHWSTATVTCKCHGNGFSGEKAMKTPPELLQVPLDL
jgi:hypothetical protein